MIQPHRHVWEEARATLAVGSTFEKSGEVCTVVGIRYDGTIEYRWPDEDDSTYWLDPRPTTPDEIDDWSDVCL